MSKPNIVKMTFEAYQRQMIAAAKLIQGDNYFGDAYYMQDDFIYYYDFFYSPEAAVREDMTYGDG